MAPVDDPKVTIMITVDEPGTSAYYAGLVAVPYAKILFTDMFNYMDSKFSKENENYIARDIVIPEIRGLKLNDAEKKLKDLKLDYEVEGDGSTVKTSIPYPGYIVKEGSKIKLNTTGASSNSVIMPSILGYSLDDAKALLESLGINYSISGKGTVSEQGIPQGELIQKGTTVRVQLSANYKD